MNTIFGNFGWELGGGTKRRGERSANFARRALAEKGGIFLQPLLVSLLLFLVKFFQTGRSASFS